MIIRLEQTNLHWTEWGSTFLFPSEKNHKLYESRLQATPKIARAKYFFVLSSAKFYQFDLKPIL